MQITSDDAPKAESSSAEIPPDPRVIDAATIAEREREGRGSPSEQRANGAPLSAARAVPPDENASEDRWRQWQQKNQETDRKDARRMRFVFTAVFVAVGMWVGFAVFAAFLR